MKSNPWSILHELPAEDWLGPETRTLRDELESERTRIIALREDIDADADMMAVLSIEDLTAKDFEATPQRRGRRFEAYRAELALRRRVSKEYCAPHNLDRQAAHTAAMKDYEAAVAKLRKALVKLGWEDTADLRTVGRILPVHIASNPPVRALAAAVDDLRNARDPMPNNAATIRELENHLERERSFLLSTRG